ncbi:3-isopropylmalate dehydratase small subunit [Myxococcota bacterium]|nr:3-isopropylmalate dehydratase small subunit [Myxococcota bacterium]
MSAERPDRISGIALVLPDDAAADLLHPPRHFSLDAGAVSRGALAGLPEVARALAEGAGPWIVVAGRDLGAGSSRETTLYALRDRGIVAAVADSAGRIFTRNAWNLGLPVVEVPGARLGVRTGDPVVLDLPRGALLLPSGEEVPGTPPDPYWLAVYRHGGLLDFAEAMGRLPGAR